MLGSFEVLYQGKAVGKGCAQKQGMSYLINCKCSLPDKAIYNLWFITEKQQIDLGICVPVFSVRTTNKVFANQGGYFELRKKADNCTEVTYCDEPDLLTMLENLPQLCLQKVNGKRIIIVDKPN